MKRNVLLVTLFLVACTSAAVKPQATGAATPIINQYPTLLPTPTLAINTRPISEEEKEEAFNFFYELKNNMALGKYEHFAEEIRYPITVNVNGQPIIFVYVSEFEANFEKIFSKEMNQKFISTDESELTFTPNGVKVADGIIWFNLICMDTACEEAEFLITEINN